MEFGQPLTITKEMVELYKVNKREAISNLLIEIQNVKNLLKKKNLLDISKEIKGCHIDCTKLQHNDVSTLIEKHLSA